MHVPGHFFILIDVFIFCFIFNVLLKRIPIAFFVFVDVFKCLFAQSQFIDLKSARYFGLFLFEMILFVIYVLRWNNFLWPLYEAEAGYCPLLTLL